MNIRGRLALILGVVLVVDLAVGFYAARSYQESARSEGQVRDWACRAVSTSLSAQVDFKKQVQEWKNILLRGHEPDLYDKYLSQFHAEEVRTRDAVEELLTLLDEGSEAWRIAHRFQVAHMELGKRYREALKAFKGAAVNPHIAVDKQVRGIDREPTDLLDRVVAATLEQKDTRLFAIQTHLQRTSREILVVAFLVVTAGIAILVWVADRTIGRPIQAATRIARRISAGDLTGKIEPRGHGESAELLRAMQSMQESLAASQTALQESAARTRLLLDSTGEGIYGVNREGRCMFINPAGVRLLGYEHAGELLDQELHSLMHHTRTDGAVYPTEECRASRTFLTGEVCHVDDEFFWHRDGTSFPVEYGSYPIHRDGELIGAVVTFSDITERKRSEAALAEAHAALQKERAQLAARVRQRTAELNLANEELARSARAKDEFLAAMSHELRTPLTTVVGTSEMLSDWLYGELNDAQARAVSNIEESAHHLLALINDILDVAKVEAGKMELVWDDVPVAQLCEASLRLIRHTAKKKGLKVSSRMDGRARIVHGDNRRLKQLLVNLLSNAVKFTPEGGSVALEVEGHTERDVVEFRVRDTGIGIAPEHMARMFKPFVQLDNQLTREYSGTGLGLALSYRMAELHGGGIAVESALGQGSCFTVTLPWRPDADRSELQPAPETGREETASGQPGQGLSVLLAEDNQANATMLTDFLIARGYQITHAADGVEAVARARQSPPDMILMDIQMPNLDGLEATRLIRADASLAKVPIIAITALTMPGDRERCREAGADEYLSKPVGMNELLQVMERLRASAGHGA